MTPSVGDADFTLATAFTTDLEFNVAGLRAQTDCEFTARTIAPTATNGEAGAVASTITKAGDIVTYNVDRPLFNQEGAVGPAVGATLVAQSMA